MKVVIVGCGVAGANAARAVAAHRPGADIHIYSAEPHLYYARPKLPAYLAGEAEESSLFFYDMAWYQERGIQVHTGARVVQVQPTTHRVVLEEGSSVAYDRLLIAAGAHPFRPPIVGADLPGVFSLWSIADAKAIRAHARTCRCAVVIGGGVLGLEAARALRALGLEVTVLDRNAYLMSRQLDAPGAAVFQRHIEALGIQVVLEASTERIEGSSAPEAVLLRGGERLPADLVLIQAGGRPNIEFTTGSGLAVNSGIVVNEHLQASAPDVYAAGDVAEFRGAIYGIVPAAVEQAQVAAANLTEVEQRRYGGTVPTNTLKIVGIDLTSIGRITAAEGDVELRRDTPAGQYLKFVLQDGRLAGAILLGHKGKVGWVSQAIAKRVHLAQHGEALLQDDFDWKAALAAS